MTARARTQFKSIAVVKSHTVALMRDQSGHQLVLLWQSWISFDRPAVTMAWQVCFHGNTFVTSVERGQSVGGESPMRIVGLEGKLITLMMIQSASRDRMRKSVPLPVFFSWNWNLACCNGVFSGWLSSDVILQIIRCGCWTWNKADRMGRCKCQVVRILRW